MIPDPARGFVGSDGGGLAAVGGPGGDEISVGHLDPEDTLTLMADDVKKLRVANRSRHRLTVAAALARHDRSHLPVASNSLRPLDVARSWHR